jgi:hypothetical protein
MGEEQKTAPATKKWDALYGYDWYYRSSPVNKSTFCSGYKADPETHIPVWMEKHQNKVTQSQTFPNYFSTYTKNRFPFSYCGTKRRVINHFLWRTRPRTCLAGCFRLRKHLNSTPKPLIGGKQQMRKEQLRWIRRRELRAGDPVAMPSTPRKKLMAKETVCRNWVSQNFHFYFFMFGYCCSFLFRVNEGRGAIHWTSSTPFPRLTAKAISFLALYSGQIQNRKNDSNASRQPG